MEDEEKKKEARGKEVSDNQSCSEIRYRSLFDNSPASITVVNEKGVITDCNKATEELSGYSKSEIIGKSFTDLLSINPEDLPNIIARFKELPDGLAQSPYELQIIRKNGEKRLIRVLNSLLFTDKEFADIQVIFQDITESRRSEEEIEMERNKLDKIISQNPYAIAIYDSEGIYVRGNQAFLNLFKAHPPKGYSIFSDPIVKAAGYGEGIEERIHKGEIVAVPDLKYNPHDLSSDLPDHTIYFRTTLFPILDSNGDVENIILMFEDITKRKMVEEGLRESEEKFRNYIENAPDGILVVDVNGRYLEANSAICKMTGYSKEELLSMSISDLLAQESQKEGSEHFDKVISDGHASGEIPLAIVKKDGKVIYLRVDAVKISENRYIGFLKDVTHKKIAEETLQQHTKELASLLKISQGFTTSLDLEKVLQMSIDEAVKLLELGTGAIYLVEDDELYLGATTPPLPMDFLKEFRRANINDHPHIKKALKTKRPVILNDTRMADLTPSEREISESRNLRTILYIPLVGHDKIIGVYIVGSIGEPTEITESMVNLGRTLSNQTALAILDAKLFGELKESEEKYRLLHENAGLGIGYWTPDGRLISFNKVALNIMGGELGDFVGKSVLELFGDDLGLLYLKRFEEIAQSGQSINYEDLVNLPSGEKWYLTIYNRITDSNGRVLGIQVISNDINERKKAEEQIFEKEYLLSKAQEIGQIGTWELDISKNNLVWTDENYRIFGLPIGTPLTYEIFLDCVHPEDRDFVDKKWTRGMKENDYDIEHRLIVDDKIKWVREKAEITYNENGEPIKAIGFTQDVTDRKRAEELFKESANDYQTLFESMREGFALCEVIQDENEEPVDYRFLKMNPAFSEQSGVDKEKIIGRTIKEVYPDVEPFWIQRYGNVAITQNSIHFEDYNHNTDRYYNAIAYSPEKGKFAMIFKDITDRKKAEDALIESEEKFRNLSEQSPNMIFINQMGRVVYANMKCEEVLGYTREEFYDHDFDFIKLIAPEYRNLLKENFDIHKDGNDVPPIEYGLITKQGRRLDCILTTKLIKYEGKSAILGIVTDITERKKAEAALKESEEKHRTLFETMTQGVVYQNVKGDIISANSAAVEVLGLSVDQMMGRTSMDPRWKAIHEDGTDFSGETHPSMVALKTGEEVRNVVMGVFHPRQEKHVWININAVPQFRKGESKPYQVYTTFEDITDRIEAEEHIRSSLHEKELLLKEIHHRVKNNLQVISSMLSLQSMHIMDDDLKAMFKESQGRVQTMAIVHEKMYQSPDLSKIGFAEYLKALTNELFASYGVDSSRIKSHVDVVDIKLGVDVAIPCGLIVNELISNSLKHAFPNGEKGEIKVILVRDEKDKFNLVVGDNGIGFPKGTDFKQMESLGLRLVNTLVDQLKGTIELENQNGTTFKIKFKAPEKLKGLI